MNRRFDGKTAVVTGSSRGIGRAIGVRLASEGAYVVINYAAAADAKYPGAAEEALRLVREAGGEGEIREADVADTEATRKLLRGVADAHGLDILVNNAGIYEFSPLESITEEHYHKSFDLNVLGLLLVSQAALKLFDSNGGCIIDTSAFASTVAIPSAVVYSATKGAVDAITRSLAAELGPRRIRINAIRPGIVETEGTHAGGFMESDMRKQVEAQTPLGRIGQPQDIASAAVFLASADSSWITGETFLVSGGYR